MNLMISFPKPHTIRLLSHYPTPSPTTSRPLPFHPPKKNTSSFSLSQRPPDGTTTNRDTHGDDGRLALRVVARAADLRSSIEAGHRHGGPGGTVQELVAGGFEQIEAAQGIARVQEGRHRSRLGVVAHGHLHLAGAFWGEDCVVGRPELMQSEKVGWIGWNQWQTESVSHQGISLRQMRIRSGMSRKMHPCTDAPSFARMSYKQNRGSQVRISDYVFTYAHLMCLNLTHLWLGPVADSNPLSLH